MRIARVKTGEEIRTAVVSPDGQTVRVLGPETSVLDALASHDTEQLTAGSAEHPHRGGAATGADRPTRDPRLLGVRAAHRGDRQRHRPRRAGARKLVRVAVLLLLKPRRGDRTRRRDRDAARICTISTSSSRWPSSSARPGRNLTPKEAGAYIAGYTIFNDWSARDLQFEEMKLGLGICKGKDFANTLGPWIVTPDELEPFRAGDRLDLDLRATVNDRELGDDTLANMAWSFEELVSYASRGTWIRPGDVLGSGTCGAGCLLELRGRHGRDAYPALAPGDTVTLSVQGIGTLTNTVVAGPRSGRAARGLGPAGCALGRVDDENRLPRPRAPARLPGRAGTRTAAARPIWRGLHGVDGALRDRRRGDLGRTARRVPRRRRRPTDTRAAGQRRHRRRSSTPSPALRRPGDAAAPGPRGIARRSSSAASTTSRSMA